MNTQHPVARRIAVGAAICLAIGMASSLGAFAQNYNPLPPLAPTATSTSSSDVNLEAGITPKLGAQLDLNLTFRDELGRKIRLADIFASKKPVVLQLGYFKCPQLCGEVSKGMLRAFKTIEPSLYTDFEAISVSIDPKETPTLAAQKRLTFTRDYGRDNAVAGWHFLTGDKASIDALATATGFAYRYDPETLQFAHGGGIIVLTPAGQTSRYLGGIEYPSDELTDALQEAGLGKVSSKVSDFLRMLCYHYDPTTNTWSIAIEKVVSIASFITVIALGGAVVIMLLREKRRRELEDGVGHVTVQG
jgi:protein SCO1/2